MSRRARWRRARCCARWGHGGVEGNDEQRCFGDDARRYHETLCGGAGAGPGFAGASGVQTHMTNSCLTAPEALDTRFPVLVEAFGIRRGSDGAGERRGDGVTRRLRFLEPMRAAMIDTPGGGGCGAPR